LFIAYIPWSLDITYTARYSLYLDLNLEIDNEGPIRSKLYDKRDDFNFPIVNFPFICSNIQDHMEYMFGYSRAYGVFQDLRDRGLMITRKLWNQRFTLVEVIASKDL
jgi:hypothetical protein